MQADPYILIADEVLANHARWLPKARLEWQFHDDPSGASGPGCRLGGTCYKNWLLHIDADNQHLVYRIGDYRAEPNVWEAAWPD